MRKLIGAINLTLDGLCDHTAIVPDDELHQHYADLLDSAGIILYGRITYQLMEYWKTVVEKPTGIKATDEFATIMDRTPKLVFSNTLKKLDWSSAKLAEASLEEEVLKLKQQSGKDVFVGSRSLIIALTKLGLMDEYQFCVHPVIAGRGLPLFDNDINHSTSLTLLKTKLFGSGAIVLYYKNPHQQ